MNCPNCGTNKVRKVNETTITEKEKFGFFEACCGYIIFGPIGILCGICGSDNQRTVREKSYYECDICGKSFKG